MKTEFEIADSNGRELFKHYCKQQNWCKVVRESRNEFAHWDIAYTSGSTLVIGEIKVRNYNSNSFSDWDYEVNKHNNLLIILDEMKLKHPNKKIEIQYINIFQDEGVKIWTTTNIANEQQPVLKYRPKTTLGDATEITKALYKCTDKNESDRGLLNDIFVNLRYDNDEDDILPF